MAKRKTSNKPAKKTTKSDAAAITLAMAENLNDKLLNLIRSNARDAFEQGNILFAITDQELWRVLGYASFSDYVDMLGFTTVTVNKRIQTWRGFSGRNFDMDLLSQVGTEKAYFLSFGVDGRTNVNKLLAEAIQKPLELVEQESRKHRGLPRRTFTYRPMFQAKLRYPKHLADIESAIADIVDSGFANTRGDAIHYLAKGYIDAVRR